jgi:hypothetical protein
MFLYFKSSMEDTLQSPWSCRTENLTKKMRLLESRLQKAERGSPSVLRPFKTDSKMTMP